MPANGSSLASRGSKPSGRSSGSSRSTLVTKGAAGVGSAKERQNKAANRSSLWEPARARASSAVRRLDTTARTLRRPPQGSA